MCENNPSDYKNAELAKQAAKPKVCGGHCRFCEGIYMPERRGQRNVCVCSECGDWFEEA